jgi:hypothetical protein
MVDINSLACRPRRVGVLESSEVPLLASAGPERASVGWLDLRNKRERGMPNRCTGYDWLLAQMEP